MAPRSPPQHALPPHKLSFSQHPHGHPRRQSTKIFPAGFPRYLARRPPQLLFPGVPPHPVLPGMVIATPTRRRTAQTGRSRFDSHHRPKSHDTPHPRPGATPTPAAAPVLCAAPPAKFTTAPLFLPSPPNFDKIPCCFLLKLINFSLKTKNLRKNTCKFWKFSVILVQRYLVNPIFWELFHTTTIRGGFCHAKHHQAHRPHPAGKHEAPAVSRAGSENNRGCPRP